MRGLIGLRGQSMSGRRDLTRATELARMINTRSGQITLDAEYIADVFAWGAGGTGGSSANTYGGGGGAAGYSRLMLPRGSRINWASAQPTVGGSVGSGSGNQGGATTVTVNDVTMTAQGGRAGVNFTPAAQAVATGFQVNRYGGGTGQVGEEGGGIDSGGGIQYAGGGAGGFRDLFPGFTGGSGWRGLTGNGAFSIPDVGGGGGANSNGSEYATWGGPGLVLILLYRYV